VMSGWTTQCSATQNSRLGCLGIESGGNVDHVPELWAYGHPGSSSGILCGVGLLAVTLSGACPGDTTGMQDLRKEIGIHGIIVLRNNRPNANCSLIGQVQLSPNLS
jgi:hypothetical protein